VPALLNHAAGLSNPKAKRVSHNLPSEAGRSYGIPAGLSYASIMRLFKIHRSPDRLPREAGKTLKIRFIQQQ
jgi:hypothetical protein